MPSRGISTSAADGQIVCIHDDTLKRTAGVDRPVRDLSLDELRRLDVGSWKSPQFAGEPLATLEEMLATIPHGKRFYVEIKCGAEIVTPLARAISACGLAEQQTVPICLELPVIAEIKRAIPQCPAYWVVAHKRIRPIGSVRLMKYSAPPSTPSSTAWISTPPDQSTRVLF